MLRMAAFCAPFTPISRIRSRSTARSYFTFNLSCLVLGTLFPVTSCRDYEFPMCPPKEWKVPGGKITADGVVDYELVCESGYTQPILYNSSKPHVCVAGTPEKLPRRCVPKIYAYVTLQYAIGIQNLPSGKSVCNDRPVLDKLKAFNFKRYFPRRRRLRRKGQGRADGAGQSLYTRDHNHHPTVRDHHHKVNEQFDPAKLKVHIEDCGSYHTKLTYMKIHIKNVQKGNGTWTEVKMYYNFIISETFKHLKNLLLAQGFKMEGNLAEPLSDDTLADASGLRALASRWSREHGFYDPEGHAADTRKLYPTLGTGLGAEEEKDEEEEEAWEKYEEEEEDDDDDEEEEELGGGALHAWLYSTGAPPRNASGFSAERFAEAGGVREKRAAAAAAVVVAAGGKPVFVDLKSTGLADPAPEDEEAKFYFGLHKTKLGGPQPVSFDCPSHLEMRIDEEQERICVGCGKGWFLRKGKNGEPAKCYPCGPGFYTDVDTATECEACPVKYTHAPWDAPSIDDCFKITIDASLRKRWVVAGFMLPIVFVATVTIAVVWISKLLLGTTTYERKPARKIHKSSR